MEEGISQGCPLSPIFASLVVTNLLQPFDIELCERAATPLQNGDPDLLGYVDAISTCVPLVDLKFLCNQFATIGAPLGCFVNPMKTYILTSTSGHSPPPDLHQLNPTLATSISNAISRYSTKMNNIDILDPPFPTKLTTHYWFPPPWLPRWFSSLCQGILQYPTG
jgi:hypothetical protein